MHQEIKRDYEIGEVCWISVPSESSDESTRRVAAAVVHSFELPDHTNTYYVCEVRQPDYPQLEIRDGTTMATSEDGFLNFMNN